MADELVEMKRVVAEFQNNFDVSSYECKKILVPGSKFVYRLVVEFTTKVI